MPPEKTKVPTGHTLQRTMRIVSTVCLVATVAFIFANSAEIGEVSAVKSQAGVGLLNRIMELFGSGTVITEHILRKLAHFAEYMLLGFWLMLTLRAYTHRIPEHIAWPLFFGLLIPVLDESFQLLIPGRSGEVRDVLIDFGGVLAGLMVGLFVWMLARAIWDRVCGRCKPL